MKTEKEIILEMAALVDLNLPNNQAFEIIMHFAGIDGIDGDTKEALLTLSDEIHERKW